MLKKYIIFLFLITQLTCTCFAYSERDFDKMEYLKYGTVYAEEDLASRLRRLETDILGMSQSGDLESRINNLKKLTISSSQNSYFDQNNKTTKKRSAIKTFFNNLSDIMSYPVITGYTPSMDYYQNAYPYNVYRQEYMDFLNNGNNYCSYPGYSYQNRHNYLNNVRNNEIRYNRRHPNRYYRQRQYMPYSQPTDIFNNFATRSSVHILQD